MTIEIKNIIFDNLKTRFGEAECYWNLLAKIQMEEFLQKLKFNVYDDNEKLKLKTIHFEKTVKLFEEACLNFDNTKMWNYYIQFRLEDLEQTQDTEKVSNKIVEIFHTIDILWKEDKITKEVFKNWIQIIFVCQKNDSLAMQKLLNILLDGAQRWSTDLEVNVFIACALMKLPESNERIIQNFFENALYKKFTKFNDDNVDLGIDFWDLFFDWCVRHKLSYRRVMKIVNEFSNNWLYYPRKMTEHFKSKLLTVMCHCCGIQKARAYYEQNKSTTPICKSFCYKMIDIENHFAETQEELSSPIPSKIITIFEDLVHHFGSTDAQIWIDYIRYIMDVDLSQVSLLYHKAIRCLDNSLCNDFVQKYSLLKLSCKVQNLDIFD